MQVEAQTLTKETADSTLIGYQHQLNSYAFYSKHLVNSVHRFLPCNLEKREIEEIFVDKSRKDEKKDLIVEDGDRVRRRCLISSDFKSAY